MTLPIPRAVREFIDGVRSSWASAFPKAGPRDLIYALNRLSDARGNEIIALCKQLEAERSAHAETKRASEHLHGLPFEIRAERESHEHTKHKWHEASDGWATELDRATELQERLTSETAAHKETTEQLALTTRARDAFEVELDAERAARKEAERKLRDEEERHAALQSRCYEGFPSVSDGIFDALRDAERKLDALTRWRLKSTEPLTGFPETTDVQWASGGVKQGGLLPYDHLKNYEYWRFTPESLDAMEKADV